MLNFYIINTLNEDARSSTLINIDKFTTRAREAIDQSQQLASSMGHPALALDHLVLALVSQREGVVPALLDHMGVDRSALE